MSDFGEFFDKETIKNISNLVEDKMNLLNEVKDFKEKDKKLSTSMEEFENTLPEDLKEKFNDIIRLNYQVEEYYFTLAYLLGSKYGEKLSKI